MSSSISKAGAGCALNSGQNTMDYFQKLPGKIQDPHNFQRKIIGLFLQSSAIIFTITGLAKLFSAMGSSRILLNSDPVTILPFRYIFLLAASLELLVAAVCFCGKNYLIKIKMVAWLSSALTIYRLGLFWVGYQRPCSCLGNFTDAIHISPGAANKIMLVTLAYLLLGSYVILACLTLSKVKSKAVGKLKLLQLIIVGVAFMANSGHSSEQTSAEAFKTFLSSPAMIQEIDWTQTICDKPDQISYYTAAVDKTNFYIRSYLPGENLHILLSPTNPLAMPFFVGKITNMNWEIAGNLMINESDKTNIPLSDLTKVGRKILAQVLSFGIPNCTDGEVQWNSDDFTAPRYDPVIISTSTSGPNSPGTNYESASSTGSVFITNGFVVKLRDENATIYYEYSDKSLPLGVPSKIVLGKNGLDGACFVRLNILSFVLSSNLDDNVFQPTSHVLAGHYGISLVSSNKTQIEIDNAYANSRMKIEAVSKSKRYAIDTILFMTIIPLVYYFTRHVRRNR